MIPIINSKIVYFNYMNNEKDENIILKSYTYNNQKYKILKYNKVNYNKLLLSEQVNYLNLRSCIFDKNTGEFVTLALVKAFRFKVPLMEEHFNENYIESDQFPKSTFKGKVLNFDNSKLAQGKASNFDIEGDLTLHGVTKKIKTKVNITPIGDKLSITSNFSVKLFDNSLTFKH